MSQGSQLVQQDTTKSISAYFAKNLDKLKSSLTNTGLSPERMMRVAVNAVAKSPDLQRCSQLSLVGSILQSAALGLEPNTPTQQAYLIPYAGICTFQIGYRGLITLARRGGVTEVYADCIREQDKYTVVRGLDQNLSHEIKLGDRGKAVAYYAVFKTKDGGRDFEVMTIPEIEAIKNRSQAASKGKSPWQTDFDEMAKKTVLKRLLKRAPLEVEAAKGIDLDNRGDAPETVDFSEILDDMGIEAPLESAPAAKPEVGRVEAAPGEALPKAEAFKKGMALLKALDREKVEAFLQYLGWVKKDEGLDSLAPERIESIGRDAEKFKGQVEKYATLEANA